MSAGFDTNANHAGDQPDRRVGFFLGSLLRLSTRLFNLLDLIHDKAQSLHVSTKFEERVWRERNLFRRSRSVARRSGALRNVGLKFRIPKQCQTTLHPVHDARALTNEALTLTVRALRILLRQRWNRCHVTVIWFATQPTDEDAFEQSSVEPICFRAAMLARYGYARWS